MRLRASGDRHEVRQQYLPSLWTKTVGRLREEGKEAAQSIIDFMDSYYLTKDDYDSILELGVGPMDSENIKIETSAKAQFTRLYNSQSHPMPFVKASSVGGLSAKMGGAAKAKPDLEEALDDSEDEVGAADAAPEEQPAEDEDEGELDLKKDKYISAPKKKKVTAAKDGAGKAKPKGKGKRKKDAVTDDGDDESDGTASAVKLEDDDEDEGSERPKKAAKKSAGTGAKKGRPKKA